MTAETTELAGLVAVVSGAAGGLGRAYVDALAGAGATVVAVDVDPAVATVAAARTALADVGRLTDVEQLAAGIRRDLGGVDILVNNAARWAPTPIDASRQQALAEFDELFAANTIGPFLLQRALVGSMVERGGGHIVNITSTEVLPPDEQASDRAAAATDDVAAASKWALNGFTQAWALSLREAGVRVNAIAVGPTDTALGRRMYGLPADGFVSVTEQAELLLALLAEGPGGRTGETVAARPGAPLRLPPRRARGEDLV